MAGWLAGAVLGGHEKAGKHRLRGSNQPLRKSKLTTAEVKSLELLRQEKRADDHIKILFLLFCRKSNEYFFEQDPATSIADMKFLTSSKQPRGLEPRDRAICSLVRLLGTIFDGLLTLNFGIIRYRVGAGLPLKLAPLAGPIMQIIIFTFLMFVWVPRQIGLPAGEWALLPRIVPLGISFAPVVGPIVGDYFRPAFMTCRSVTLMLKMRSMMFNDVIQDGKWYSQALTEYFGTEIRYSQRVREAVMGRNNEFLGGDGLFASCC